MKYCSNCGNKIENDTKFCPNCGENVKSEENLLSISTKSGNEILFLILTIITCGLFEIIWIIIINEKLNDLRNEKTPSSGLVILLYLFTCGIYGIYWYYKVGEKIYDVGEICGVKVSNNSILYLVLSIFHFNALNCFFIQSDLNKFED